MPPLSAKALGQEWVRVTSVKGKSRRLQLALEGGGVCSRELGKTHIGLRVQRTAESKQASFRAGALCSTNRAVGDDQSRGDLIERSADKEKYPSIPRREAILPFEMAFRTS